MLSARPTDVSAPSPLPEPREATEVDPEVDGLAVVCMSQAVIEDGAERCAPTWLPRLACERLEAVARCPAATNRRVE